MSVQNVLIKFEADTSELEPAIDTLEQTGQIDKKTAEQFRKTNKLYQERSKAVKDMVSDQATLDKSIDRSKAKFDDLAKAMKNADKAYVGKASKEVLNEIEKAIGSTNDEFEQLAQTLDIVKANYDKFNLTPEEFKQLDKYIEVSEQALKEFGDQTVVVEAKEKKLTAQLADLREEMARLKLDGKENSEEYKKMASDAVELTKAISDTNKEVKNLSSDSLAGLIDVTGGVIGVFSAFQAITALVGDENEDLQKTLVKLNALIALLSGLTQVQNVLKKESAAATLLQTVRQALYTVVVGKSTGALKAFRIALAATGIGLAVIAVGLLVANWDKLTAAVTGFNKQSRIGNQVRKEALKNIQDERVELLELVAIAKNENVSKKERQEAIKKLNEDYPEYLSNIDLENIATKDTNDLVLEQIKLMGQREQVRLLSTKLATLSNKLLEEETELTLTFYQKAKAAIAGIFSPTAAVESISKSAAKNRAKIEEEIRITTELLNQLITDIAGTGKDVFKNLGDDTDEGIKAAKGSLAALQKQLSELQTLINNTAPDDPLFQPWLHEAERLKLDIEALKFLIDNFNSEIDIDIVTKYSSDIPQFIASKLKEVDQLFNDGEITAEEKNSRKYAIVIEYQKNKDLISTLKNELKKVKDAEREFQQGLIDTQGDLNTDTFAKNIRRLEFLAEEELKLEKKKQDLLVQFREKAFESTFAIANSFFQRELQALEKKNRQGIISDEEYERKKSALLKKQAIAQKAQSIFQIVNNTASAIMASLVLNPLPQGAPLVALIASTGALQLGTVLAEPIPQFKKGTKGSKKTPPGFKWVGEEGPELMYDGGGKKIFTNEDSMALAKLFDEYNIAHSFKMPNSPKVDAIRLTKMPHIPNDVIQNIFHARGLEIDYDKLSKSISGNMKLFSREIEYLYTSSEIASKRLDKTMKQNNSLISKLVKSKAGNERI